MDISNFIEKCNGEANGGTNGGTILCVKIRIRNPLMSFFYIKTSRLHVYLNGYYEPYIDHYRRL